MSAEPTRFVYRLEFADYLALGRARERLGPLRGWGRVLRYPVWIALFLATLWWMDGFGAPLSVYLSWPVLKWLLAIPVMIFLIDLIFRQVVYRWVFSRYAVAGKEAVVTLDEAGIAWTLGPVTGSAPWSSIVASVATPEHVFLFLSRIEAITLPRRGLQEGDFAALPDVVEARTGFRPLSG